MSEPACYRVSHLGSGIAFGLPPLFLDSSGPAPHGNAPAERTDDITETRGTNVSDFHPCKKRKGGPASVCEKLKRIEKGGPARPLRSRIFAHHREIRSEHGSFGQVAEANHTFP